jgi:hypothetical protein
VSPATRAWLSAFLFTQVVEIPIYVAALRRTSPHGLPAPLTGLRDPVVAAFGASLITHPIVWFVFPRLPLGSYEGMVAGAETFAVVAEGLYFYALGAMALRRAMVVSLLANASSASLGLLSRYLFGWP